MVLQTSGAISLSDVEGEFQGSAPTSIDEYYRGGVYVPDTTANASIPQSGTIDLGDFYGGDDTPATTDLYFFNSNTFENCGSGGQDGPTLAQCQSTYAGQAFLSSHFSVNNGIQQWVVPSTANYTFKIRGGHGGAAKTNYNTSGTNGGEGAYLQFDIDLNMGDVLKLVVGQEPTYAVNPGGGGGSWVVKYDSDTATETLIAVAGGGGGGGTNGTSYTATDQGGQSGTAGGTGRHNSQYIGSNGGTSGNGGESAGGWNGSGGGGAWNGDGDEVWFTSGGSGSSQPQYANRNGKGWSNGLQGGTRRVYGSYNNAHGGFGGGGAGGIHPYPGYGGGGGGYSGGGGGWWNGRPCEGGGGGSFVAASAINVTKTDGGNWLGGEDGYIEIEKNTPPTASFVSPATSINEGVTTTYTVNTTSIANGSSISWSISHTSTSSLDFLATAGTATVNNNQAAFTVRATADSFTEGSESFALSISYGVTNLANQVITVNDTSTNATAAFSNPTLSVNEGTAYTYQVTTTNIPDGGYVEYFVQGLTTDVNPAAGTASVWSNSAAFNLTPVADQTTEGSETFTIEIKKSLGGTLTLLATSPTITINDTSLDPPFTAISWPSSIEEGNTASFQVDIDPTFSSSGSLSYLVTHVTTSAADFSGSISGSFSFTNHTGSFSITAASDSTSDQAETFTLSVLDGAVTVLSRTITIVEPGTTTTTSGLGSALTGVTTYDGWPNINIDRIYFERGRVYDAAVTSTSASWGGRDFKFVDENMLGFYPTTSFLNGSSQTHAVTICLLHGQGVGSSGGADPWNTTNGRRFGLVNDEFQFGVGGGQCFRWFLDLNPIPVSGNGTRGVFNQANQGQNPTVVNWSGPQTLDSSALEVGTAGTYSGTWSNGFTTVDMGYIKTFSPSTTGWVKIYLRFHSNGATNWRATNSSHAPVWRLSEFISGSSGNKVAMICEFADSSNFPSSGTQPAVNFENYHWVYLKSSKTYELEFDYADWMQGGAGTQHGPVYTEVRTGSATGSLWYSGTHSATGV